MTTYGTALRRARLQAGLSQGALGNAVGVDRAHIARIESGSIRIPQPELRQKIAAALGGEPEDLEPIGETGPRADLLRTTASLSDQEAETVLAIIEALQQHRWGRGPS